MGLVSPCNHISEGRDDTKRGFFTCLFPFPFLHELPSGSYILGADSHPISSYSAVPQITLLIQVTVTDDCPG